jgi:tRNA threonylcarbamoyladenosine biosynthesis protein TsaB
MLVLALDTTTRQGSAALARDGSVVGVVLGDPNRTHGARLPGDLLRLLESQGIRIADIDLYTVAAGPGSFTGLRIGIATMQGLALANGKGVAGVSALDALNRAASSSSTDMVGVWMDAQRGEVFSALYRGSQQIDGPAVEDPGDCLARWKLSGGTSLTLVGDGALVYADVVRREMPGVDVAATVPPLAPTIAQMGLEVFERGGMTSPDAIRPIYVRRPDAELAKERRLTRASVRPVNT